MLCPVHHNWLRVAGAVFLALEITEVAETTDNHGDTETRRMRVAALSAARDSSSRLSAGCHPHHLFSTSLDASASPR